jgi:hypothetical protein
MLLEIISGIPMWISYKCILNRKGRDVLGFGLFSSINRGFDKILVSLFNLIYSFNSKSRNDSVKKAGKD